MIAGLPQKRWRIVLSRNCTLERIVEAENEAEVRRFVMDIVGLTDFALAAGATVTADTITLETVGEA